MGRDKRNKYFRTLHQQAHGRLVNMQAFGASRAKDKQTGVDRGKIYSYSTYKSYRRAVMRFVKYVETCYPECTTLRKSRKYVNEWLQSRVDAGLSAWTVSMETSALCKLYSIMPDNPDRFQVPQRKREDIKRSRVDVARDKHFSIQNNDELIKFVSSTGTRRNVLERLRGDDLWSRRRMTDRVVELKRKKDLTEAEDHQLAALSEALAMFPEIQWFVHHRKDKGGRYRFAPIIGPHQEQVVARMQNTAPDKLVWQHVHSAADIHSYRAKYAQQIYRMYARDIKDIPYNRINKGSGKKYQGDVYSCKNDEHGRKLDRAALLKASRALGHNRIDVVPRNYLYGL